MALSIWLPVSEGHPSIVGERLDDPEPDELGRLIFIRGLIVLMPVDGLNCMPCIFVKSFMSLAEIGVTVISISNFLIFKY